MRCHCRRLVVCLCASLETTERFPPREERGRLNREGRMGVRCGATEWRAMRCHCRRSVVCLCASVETAERFPPREKRGH